ncbi:MAG: class I SAM-dependent methyltransferase [Methanobacterium sp.]|jgi:predicted transcriptional regulator
MNVTDRPAISVEGLQNIVQNAVNGLKIFNLLKTSIEMGIFDFLNKETTCKQLSERLEIEPVLTHYLLEILVELGLVEKIGESYKNTPLSEIYLNSESEYKRVNCILSMEEPANLWHNLNNTLKGKIARKDETFFPFIIQVLAEDCLSGELQDTSELVANYDEFKHSKTLLDLGGGHGMYSIAFSQINPDLHCYVFDLPDVVKETQKYIERYNSNVQTIPGNFYTDDFGGSYDIIFSSYNPGGKNPEIARKVYNSLNLNGLFINKQYFPENGSNSLGDLLDNMEWNFTKFEKSNKASKRFTFKEDLSFGEYLEFLENLGFSVLDVHTINHFNTSFGTISEDKMIIAKKVR